MTRPGRGDLTVFTNLRNSEDSQQSIDPAISGLVFFESHFTASTRTCILHILWSLHCSESLCCTKNVCSFNLYVRIPYFLDPALSWKHAYNWNGVFSFNWYVQLSYIMDLAFSWKLVVHYKLYEQIICRLDAGSLDLNNMLRSANHVLLRLVRAASMFMGACIVMEACFCTICCASKITCGFDWHM